MKARGAAEYPKEQRTASSTTELWPECQLCRVGSPSLVRLFGVATRLPLGHVGVFMKRREGEWHKHREFVSERKQSYGES